MSALAARLTRLPGFWAWLPVVLLPPVLILDAAVSPEEGKGVTLVGALTAVVACLPLAVRRRLPFRFLAPLLTGGIVLVLWTLEPGDTVVLVPAVALAELAARTHRRHAVWVGVAVLPCVAVSVAPFAETPSEFFGITLRNLAYCLLALAAGDAVRSRREAIERTAAASEERALRRLSDERLRIARDVHDVVAHAMVAINVQAGVAAHLLDRDPEQARDALQHIKATSGEALDDLRGTLGVLRDPDAAAPVTPAGVRADVEQLAGGLRAAGLRVELDVEPPADVAPDVRAACHRIVQEAFTNVLRHAQATAVRVRMRADGDALQVEVVDDGKGKGAPGGAGQGLRGMRERVAALGGTLESGPAPGGGWRVAARLPAGVGTAA